MQIPALWFSFICSLCMYQKVFFLFLRLQQLDEENCELRSCVPCLRANIERLEEVRPIKWDFSWVFFAHLVDSLDY